jgi:hypothetical protein
MDHYDVNPNLPIVNKSIIYPVATLKNWGIFLCKNILYQNIHLLLYIFIDIINTLFYISITDTE